MRNSQASWKEEAGCLHLVGEWSADSVARYWLLLPRQHLSTVDLSGVTQLDSSLMTLLLSLQSSVGSLRLLGVPKVVMSLLVLYELTPFFAQIEEVV
jgi:ABC-type transporter Mla MlaB component